MWSPSGNVLRYIDEFIFHVVRNRLFIFANTLGPGRLFQVVEHLQFECDKQANQILDEFRRGRQLDKQIRQVTEAQR